MIHTLCYVSHECAHLDKAGLKDIFDKTLKYNEEKQITGILLYQEGSFFQVLEGDKEVLLSLMDFIKKDNRHKDLILIFDKPSHRIFNTYKTGFSVIDKGEELERLKEYLSEKKDILSSSASINGIIQSFIR